MSHTYRHTDWEPLERARRVDLARRTEAKRARLRRTTRTVTHAEIVGRHYRAAGDPELAR